MTVGTAAIVVAGGTGSRLGVSGGKQLMPLLGVPVVSWALKALDEVAAIKLIVLVRPPERSDEFAEAVRDLCLETPILFAPSGATRQDSTVSGMSLVPAELDFVAIHDGARPLVLAETVTGAIALLEATPDADGVVVGHPSVDTVKFVDNGRIASTPDRGSVWMAQTPQIFRATAFRRALRLADESGFVGTDDGSVMEQSGGMVLMFEGPRDNIKVTVAEDVTVAQAVLTQRAGGR